MAKFGAVKWGDFFWGSESAPPLTGDGSELSTLRSLVAAYSDGLGTTPSTPTRTYKDISSAITTFNFSELPTVISIVSPSDIQASIEAVVSNLPTSLYSIRPSNLSTFIGGHLPSGLSAQIFSVAPSDISGWLIPTVLQSTDISSVVTATGGYLGIISRIIITSPSTSDIRAILRVREPKDLLTSVSGWRETNLSVSIAHTYSAPNFRTIIKGIASVTRDIGVWLIPSNNDTIQLPVFLKSMVSTHTSSKLPNIGKFPLNARNNFALGTRFGGASFISIEPIFGTFPDLSASINGEYWKVSDISSIIKGTLTFTGDIAASIEGLTPKINISKTTLSFVYFRSLGVSITSIGYYSSMPGSIKSWVATSTSSATDAGFTLIKSTTRQFISSSGGIIAYDPIQQSIKNEYHNDSDTPDLNSVIYGWDSIELLASITALLQEDLPCTVNVQDSTHIKSLAAIIHPFHYTSFGGSITSAGAFSELSAILTPKSFVTYLGASINGYIGTAGREFIAVHTKPFVDFGATINFNSSYSCSLPSGYVDMPVFVRTNELEFSDISVNIVALSDDIDMEASVRGLKFTRAKILSLYFRSMARSSSGLASTIRGWSNSTEYDMVSSITGMSHVSDIQGSINVVRYKPIDLGVGEQVELINIADPADRLNAEVLFGSGPSSYTYSPSDGNIYSKDSERWSILVREVKTSDEFFQAAPAANVNISSIKEHDSIDEAIRNSLDSLIVPNNSSLSVSITAAGGLSSLIASVVVTARDKLADLPATIVPVYNSPDIMAIIDSSGSFSSFRAIILPSNSEDISLSSEIFGVVLEDLFASVVAI